MTYTMSLSYTLGNQYQIGITSDEAKQLIVAAQDCGATVSIENGTKQDPKMYWIFYDKK